MKLRKKDFLYLNSLTKECNGEVLGNIYQIFSIMHLIRLWGRLNRQVSFRIEQSFKENPFKEPIIKEYSFLTNLSLELSAGYGIIHATVSNLSNKIPVPTYRVP